MSKEQANYRPGGLVRNCRSCAHMNGDGSCEVVAGKVDPTYTSDLYRSKNSGRR